MTPAIEPRETSCLRTADGALVPLKGVEIRGEVVGGHARARLFQRYRNEEGRPVEAVYVFPLPSAAVLTAFAMTCAGRRIESVLKEREEAFATYDDAITAGHGAALLEEERPNVFTASVGNLLPGEETLVEVEWLERLTVDEGSLRWVVPTLVAPRYVPGSPAPHRTAHGAAEPTDRVPDADRITPAIGHAPYGLTVDVVFDLGEAVRLESPSHALSVTPESAGRQRVRLARPDVALDRDLVLVARRDEPAAGAERSWLSVAAHRVERPADSGPASDGYLAVTLVPDLFDPTGSTAAQDVVFVLDVSGSMAGASIVEARAAAKLCLRQLRRGDPARSGDRFEIVAFSNRYTTFGGALVPFDDRSLRDADRFLDRLSANGGTEMKEPLEHAARVAPDGVIVLLTDGQVGNEGEILSAVLTARRSARVYPFGIGTNVSDALLRDLAKRTGGAVESIHPGERIDEKVIAQFARATAARVTDVAVRFLGVSVHELAPSEVPALVDGEAVTLLGRYTTAGEGAVEVSGRLRGGPFSLRAPVSLPASASQPAVAALWARERIADLLHAELTGRRAAAMKDRIVAISLAHGVVSPYTSFVAVEERQGERRAGLPPQTRVVPVHAPAGWAMLSRSADRDASTGAGLGTVRFSTAMSLDLPSPAPSASRPAPLGLARERTGVVASASRPAALGGALGAVFGGKAKKASRPAETVRPGGPGDGAAGARPDPVVSILSRQGASGLWDDGHPLRDTARALLGLYEHGVTATHAVHGALVKKAVEALARDLETLAAAEPQAAPLALAAAFLVTTGRRSRAALELLALRPGLSPGVDVNDEAALRAHLASSLPALR